MASEQRSGEEVVGVGVNRAGRDAGRAQPRRARLGLGSCPDQRAQDRGEQSPALGPRRPHDVLGTEELAERLGDRRRRRADEEEALPGGPVVVEQRAEIGRHVVDHRLCRRRSRLPHGGVRPAAAGLHREQGQLGRQGHGGGRVHRRSQRPWRHGDARTVQGVAQHPPRATGEQRPVDIHDGRCCAIGSLYGRRARRRPAALPWRDGRRTGPGRHLPAPDVGLRGAHVERREGPVAEPQRRRGRRLRPAPRRRRLPTPNRPRGRRDTATPGAGGARHRAAVAPALGARSGVRPRQPPPPYRPARPGHTAPAVRPRRPPHAGPLRPHPPAVALRDRRRARGWPGRHVRQAPPHDRRRLRRPPPGRALPHPGTGRAAPAGRRPRSRRARVGRRGPSRATRATAGSAASAPLPFATAPSLAPPTGPRSSCRRRGRPVGSRSSASGGPGGAGCCDDRRRAQPGGPKR